MQLVPKKIISMLPQQIYILLAVAPPPPSGVSLEQSFTTFAQRFAVLSSKWLERGAVQLQY